MTENDEQFGAMYGSLSIIDKVKLLVAWAPMLAKLEAVATAKTPQEKALALVAALRLCADQTSTTKDNSVLDHVEAILKTPEGQALIEWFTKVAGEIT
jgi:hypothetical protein